MNESDAEMVAAVESAFDEGATGAVRGLLSQPQATPGQQWAVDAALAFLEGRPAPPHPSETEETS